ncbi:unnamed protein product, partial [Closterium sp. NIES-54]
ALYDAVVARYSSPATAALGRLLLPYLFPELSAFATVADLVSHLRTSDARYRATVPAETSELLLLVRSTAAARERVEGVVEGAAVEVVEAVTVVAAVGVVAGVGALVAAVEAAMGVAIVAAVGLVAVGLELGVEVLEVASGSSSVGARPRRPSSFTCGRLHTQHRCFSRLDDAWRAEFGDEVERPRWADLLRSGVAIFDLDFDVILSAMYALSASAEGDCYRCVAPDPGIAATALGASETDLPGTAPAEALHTFTLDSGASRCFFRDRTTLTSLPAPVPVRLADPFGGPVVARSSIVLPCPAVPSGLLSGLHLPSFSTNLVSTAALQDALVTTTTPGGQHVSICLPCVEGRQLAAPHSSSFSPTTAPLQTLNIDVWGPARIAGQGRERYFLLVVDDCMWYTTVYPLCSKGQVVDFLILWIRAVRLQLRERFQQDLPVLRLHSARGGEFSSDLLRDVCRGEGILQLFTLPDSPQQNGIAEHRIGLVMEVARTSMIHVAATHFLWPFAVGDASVFWVWGSRAFVRDMSADKLSARAIPCVFLGFVPDAPGWQFYHPTSRRVLPSQDVMFDESVPFYRLYPNRSAPLPPLPLFLAPGLPPVHLLPPQGPAPSGVSQVDPSPGTVHGEVAIDSGAARGTAIGGAERGGAEPGGAETGGAERVGAGSRGDEPRGTASSGGPAGVFLWLSRRPEPLSPQQLREWLTRHARLWSGAAGAGDSAAGDAGAGGAAGAGVFAGAGGPGGAGPTGPGGARTGGARTGGTGAVGVGGAGGASAGAAGAGGAAGVGAGGTSAGASRVTGAARDGTIDVGAGGAGPGGGGAGSGDTGRPRPYIIPLLQQVLGLPSITRLPPLFLSPPPDQSQPLLQPTAPLPAPAPYTVQTGSLTERRDPASRPASPVCTGRHVPRPRPRPVPSTRAMALRPSSVPLRVPLPAPPASSLPAVPDPEYDCAHDASPTISRLLATVVTDPSFESTVASALTESSGPPSVGGECALGTEVLEDRQEDFECLPATVPRFSSMLLASEGDPDAPDIPTLRSYAEAIMANIVDGMWIFRVKRPPGSPPAFKARYVARGFSQRQGVYYFHTFSPTPKMTTLRVLLHVAAQRHYVLHSLNFSTTFLQGSLHEEIWLRRPPGFTVSFPASTQWSLRRPVYGLRQAPREGHDTLKTTLAALGFTPSAADPSLFLRTDTSLPPFCVLMYVDDLVFAIADTEALTLVKSEP